MLDAPVSGGPGGRAPATWPSGSAATGSCTTATSRCWIPSATRHTTSAPSAAARVAKLVHNCSGYIIQTALAETFTMGVKAGVEPLALWQAVRRGAQGRRGSFEGLAEHLLPGNFDPPDFALQLARKDVDLAVGVGREFNVPMRLANLTLAEMTEAINRVGATATPRCHAAARRAGRCGGTGGGGDTAAGAGRGAGVGHCLDIRG